MLYQFSKSIIVENKLQNSQKIKYNTHYKLLINLNIFIT